MKICLWQHKKVYQILESLIPDELEQFKPFINYCAALKE